MKPASLRIGLALTLLFGALALGAGVEEKFDDGKPKVKYTVDDKGRKDGLYQEFYPSGKTKLRATYKQDMLDGKYSVFDDKGRIKSTAAYQTGKLSGPFIEYDAKGKKTRSAAYKNGKLNGNLVLYQNGLPILTQVFKDGEAVFPKSKEKIAETLKEILGTAPTNPDEGSQRDLGLRRLKAYRYLCDVPYQNLTLDDQYNRQAQAAAMICAKLKRLDHQPPNPGLPEAEYKLARMGASRSNLAAGLPTLDRAVDAWMDDSRPGSIERVGHRRWCLNPAMSKTGFGLVRPFAAMYSFDQTRKTIPDFDFVCYPPRGLLPTSAFQARYAWCFCPNPRKVRRLDNNVKAKITAIDEQFRKVGEPLTLNYNQTSEVPVGMLSHCLIFRPETVDVADGQRFLVEIEGLKQTTGRPLGTVAYPVVFFAIDP